jgi:hypothetical protein
MQSMYLFNQPKGHLSRIHSECYILTETVRMFNDDALACKSATRVYRGNVSTLVHNKLWSAMTGLLGRREVGRIGNLDGLR